MEKLNSDTWIAKLAAWTHDPAEKALVLLRDPLGHEGGTVRALHETLFPGGLPQRLIDVLKRADWWASAADRPAFPRSASDGRYASWAQVRFDQEPVLIHPLSGEQYDLGRLEVDVGVLKSASFQHFNSLVHRAGDGAVDARRTALAFWRFGPHPRDDAQLGALWQLLPADTRMPDHSIWAHLDLSAALASSMAADDSGEVALLSMSLGPVQEFIAQSRTTSDLWAGSHLLSFLAWQALKIICEQFGPDAVIYPQLRGVPLVDLWLRDEVGLSSNLFEQEAWVRQQRTDSSPLFAASLPNKFVAIVPSGEAPAIAARVTKAVREFVQKLARGMVDRLLREAGIADDPGLYCYQQLHDQLAGFPEVHWAAVPYGGLVRETEGEVLDVTRLAEATEALLGTLDGSFLDSETWNRLKNPLDVEGARFYRPNPGVLYPAVYELLDNVAARAKALRDIPQRKPGGEIGYRCDLTGEAEWLTHDAALLQLPPGQRKSMFTLWMAAARNWPALGRKDEHLCATAMLKRLWPSWFVDSVLADSDELRRYVVSTHTLALASSLDGLLDDPATMPDEATVAAAARLCDAHGAERVALPARLVRRLRADYVSPALKKLLPRIPDLLDRLRSSETEDGSGAEWPRELRALFNPRRQPGARERKPEAYYGLIMLDGDRMGAWISGTEPGFQLRTKEAFHPRIRQSMESRFSQPELRNYLESVRVASPSRHMTISSALSSFALHLAREVVEEQCKGKLIYAGGDDVLALVAIDDLLRCMTLLRAAYAGIKPPPSTLCDLPSSRADLLIGGGHARHGSRLLRLMGSRASASIGAVVAHHSAPLGAVLRTLREAEQTAKREGRDRFTLSLLKRAGGRSDLTLPWRDAGGVAFGAMQVLMELTRTFANDVSRNAAYRTLGWIDHLPVLPPQELVELLSSQLRAQFGRQARADGAATDDIARKLATLVAGEGATHDEVVKRMKDMLVTAEFLAREGRTVGATR